jgi:hypothetical protein
VNIYSLTPTLSHEEREFPLVITEIILEFIYFILFNKIINKVKLTFSPSPFGRGVRGEGVIV